MKKASKWMYHIRCLRNLHVDSKISSLFYNAIVSSVVTCVIPSWFNASNARQKKDLKKLGNEVLKMVNLECRRFIDDPKLVSDRKSMSTITKMMPDCSHPLFLYLSVCPIAQVLTCHIVEQHGTSQRLSHQLLNFISQASILTM